MVRMRRESSKLDEEIFVEVCRARSIDPAAEATDCATGPVARTSDGSTTNAALSEALTCGRTAVIDCRVDPAEGVYPMIPAGAAAIDMLEYQDPQGALA